MKPLLLSALLLLGGGACLAQRPSSPLADEAADGRLGPAVPVPLALTQHRSFRWRGPLRIVDGQPLPDSVDTPPAEDIIGLRELEPAEAVKRFGPRASRGALLIDTEKRQRR
jgi:hypothetical protein